VSALKDVHYYLSLPYTIEIIREDAETWFARVKELPGCISEGDNAQDAAEMILDAMSGWVEIALADGQTIPEPRPVEDYSGKFVVRVPKSLHRDLAQEADRHGVSLNLFICTELARAVGRPDVERANATLVNNRIRQNGNTQPTETPTRYVVRDPQILSGEPIVGGTSIPVRTIVEMWRMNMTVEEIGAGFPDLSLAQIFGALSFFQDNVDEINHYIEINRITDAMVFESTGWLLRKAA